MTPFRHVFLARHGETDWNACGRWQGHTDVPLNDTGRAQARALADRLRREGVAAIATSDLARARETAELVAASLGLAVGHVDADLREQRYGWFEGLTPAECERRHPEEWARYRAEPGVAPPGGETRQALLARLLPALARAVERLDPPPLVVTHGGAMRAVLAALGPGGPPPPPPLPGRIPNGGVLRVSFASGAPVAAAWLDPGA